MILLNETSWEIKTTKDKGRGIYAKKDIAPGTVIGDYLGKVIKTAEEDTTEKDGLYLLYYHDYASIYPEDITAVGIHLVNHSCTPNSWVYIYKGHTLFFSLRKIFAGEEITISYLLSPNEFCEPCPHACICGSQFCTGTMHITKDQFTRWNNFQEEESAKTKRAPIRYGKLLPKLKAYPQTIADNQIYTLFGATDIPSLHSKESELPSIKELRHRIRTTGKKLYFSKIKTTVYGIKDNTIVTA